MLTRLMRQRTHKYVRKNTIVGDEIDVSLGWILIFTRLGGPQGSACRKELIQGRQKGWKWPEGLG